MSWVHSPKNDSWNKEYEWIWLSNTTEMGASERGVYSQNDPTWIGNWRQAIGFGLYSIFKHSNKPIYLDKRKQTMCDQQSANQPTSSCDISWLSIHLHNNAATNTIIDMYGHFEPCWKAVGCFRTKIWIRKGHQLCRVRNFMLGCPAGAQTYAHTHWTLTYIICIYIYMKYSYHYMFAIIVRSCAISNHWNHKTQQQSMPQDPVFGHVESYLLAGHQAMQSKITHL